MKLSQVGFKISASLEAGGKMKIVMITLYNPFEKINGGIEALVYHQSRALAKMAHDVWVLTMGNVEKEKITKIDGVNLWIIPDKNIHNLLLRTLWFVRKGKPIVEKLDRELGVDVFDGQAGYSGPLFFADVKKASRVLTVHTVDGENIANIKDTWRIGHRFEFLIEILKFPVLRVWRYFFFNRTDGLIFVSDLALNEFNNYYSFIKHKPCSVISNGFPKLKEKDESNLVQKEYDFVYAGRIDMLKGVDLILKAASFLGEKHIIKVAIVGDGAWKKTMQKLASSLGVAESFFFLGHLSHNLTMEVLKNSRCLVLPSFYESDPLIVKEGMALGMPIICSNIPSLRAKMSNYQKGLTFCCGSREDLARVMEEFLCSTGDVLPEHDKAIACDEAENVCTWEENTQKYLQFFSNLVLEKNGSAAI